MNEKIYSIIRIIIVIILFIFTAGLCIYILDRASSPAGRRTGSKLERAVDVNREVRDEQRGEQERNRKALELAERIRGIYQETDSALGELRDLTGRLYTIPERIRREADLLDDYFRSTGSELDDYFNTVGSE